MICPCRGAADALPYTACCGRYHAGQPAPTAEALMRSRYSAFVRKEERWFCVAGDEG